MIGLAFALLGAASSCGVQLKKLAVAPATDSEEIVCDASAIPFGGGSGTSADPYSLCDPTHVQNISTALSARFVVARDIDFSATASWIPIGSDATPFTGTLDGNGKTFSHLTISLATAANTEWVGLFQTLGAGSSVSDLVLEDFTVAGNNMTGVLAGHVIGAAISGITIRNATVNTRAMGGGIAGRAETNAVVNEVTIAGITVASSADGSLCGNTYDTGVGSLFGRTAGRVDATTLRVTGASISWSAAGVNIAGWTHVGGIVGYTASFVLSDVEFQGTINGGGSRSGGVAGQWDDNSLTGVGGMTDVHLSSTTVTTTGSAGGIAGAWNRRMRSGVAPMLRVSFQGSVQGLVHAGGVAGQGNFGNIEQVSVEADVSGNMYVGGLFGYLIFATDIGLRDVSFAGTVTGLNAGTSNYLGGVAGITHSGVAQLVSRAVTTATITNPNAASAQTFADFGNLNAGSTTPAIYHRTAGVGAYSSIRSTGLSDPQMVDSSEFAGFDFSSVWVMPTNAAYGGLASPVLRIVCGRNGITCP